MPTVKIDTPGVTVELTAAEASITELGKQAMDLFKEATQVHQTTPAGPAFGFGNDKRWTPDTHPIGPYGGRGLIGPVQA